MPGPDPSYFGDLTSLNIVKSSSLCKGPSHALITHFQNMCTGRYVQNTAQLEATLHPFKGTYGGV